MALFKVEKKKGKQFKLSYYASHIQAFLERKLTRYKHSKPDSSHISEVKKGERACLSHSSSNPPSAHIKKLAN